MTQTLVKPVWTLGDWAANVVDDNGVAWVCNVDSGWFSPLGVRSSDTDIPGYDGTYPSPNLRTPRVITISGLAKETSAAVPGAIDNAVDQFNALCASSKLQQFVVSETSRDLSASVKLGSGSDLTRTTPSSFEWQLVLIAPDPRKYGPVVTASTGLPSSTSGVDYGLPGGTGVGVDYGVPGGTGVGVDYGAPGGSGLIQLTNSGTAESWPTLTITGPTDGSTLIAPVVINTDTGNRLSYAGTLNSGDRLVIKSNPHGRSTLLNDAPYRRLLTAAEWFSVPAGGTVSVQFQGSSASNTSQLSVSLAPAYL